jgi:tetratricopeptide (TPR) repeat protein
MDIYKKEISKRVIGAWEWRPLLLVILGFLVTGCATTGSQYGGGSAPAGSGNAACASAAQAGGAQQNCQHRGPIEITEDMPVDAEIKEEFKQAVIQLKQENYPEAIRLLKTVTGKTSKFTAPYIDLGIAYSRTKEYDKAEESLKKALSINRTHPVALFELGLVNRKTGRYGDARKLYETLLQIYPDFLPARKSLGVLCDIYMQDLSCALEQYEAYLKGRPEDEKVKIWVADVKSRM